MKKQFVFFNLLCLSLLLLLICDPTTRQRETGLAETLPTPALVVLAEPGDPYAILADEIAQTENALQLHAIDELATVNAAYVLYVASPAWLTEHKLLALSTLSMTTGRYPVIGIISGSTLAHARDLWLRGAEVHAGRGFVASAIDVNAALDEDTLWELSADTMLAQPLTQANLLHALEAADYFYWARHVATTNWFWYEGEYPIADRRITGADLPSLKPIVIHTPSCRSFVPWAEDSIALAFTDHGAAAYLGHLYSPISSGYFIGHLHTLPGYDTWPGVPIGVLAQVQNRASERAFAAQPFFFMLGDPRIALQTSAPYTITSDTHQGNRRIIQGTWKSAAITPGVLPLRITGGAAYRFVHVTGVGAIADSDTFYNRSIQTLNVQGDKVALILHPGGAFEVELHVAPPLLWHQFHALRAAFEFVWCSIAPVQSLLGLLPLVILLIVGGVKLARQKPLRGYIPALLVGVAWAILQLGFCLLRAGRVSITSYPVHPTPVDLALAFVGTTGFITLGLTWMLDAHKLIGKLLGMSVCLAPSVMLLGMYAGIITLLNISMTQKSGETFWILNYASVQMTAIVGIIEIMIFLNAYQWLRSRQL